MRVIEESLYFFQSPMMQHLHGRSPPDVLVVNASRQTKSPDATEVDVVVGYEHSPAKVVCHSPAVVQSDLRYTALNICIFFILLVENYTPY